MFEPAGVLTDSTAIELNWSYETFVQKKGVYRMPWQSIFIIFECLAVALLSVLLGRFIPLYCPNSGMNKYKKTSKPVIT